MSQQKQYCLSMALDSVRLNKSNMGLNQQISPYTTTKCFTELTWPPYLLNFPMVQYVGKTSTKDGEQFQNLISG